METPIPLFSLKWNNQLTHFSVGLKTILQNDSLTDVTLCTSNGECVRSHKLLLALSSPYFKELFEMPQHKGDAGTIVILPNVRHKDLVNIIKFIYTGETRMPQEDLKRFLETCTMLKLSINAGKIGGVGDKQKMENQQQQQPEIQPKTSPPPLKCIKKPLPPLLIPSHLKKPRLSVPNGPATSPMYGIDASSFCETELKTTDLGEQVENDGQQGHHGNGANYPSENGTSTGYASDSSDQEDVKSQNKKIKQEVQDIGDTRKDTENGHQLDYSSDQNIMEGEGSGSDSRNGDVYDINEYPEGIARVDGVGVNDFHDDGYTGVSPDLGDRHVTSRFKGSRSYKGKSAIACDICGAKFHRKDSYRRHRKSHGDHQYNCEECGRGFYRRDLYNRHLESQHMKPKVL